jgi:hypothetical protein
MKHQTEWGMTKKEECDISYNKQIRDTYVKFLAEFVFQSCSRNTNPLKADPKNGYLLQLSNI